MLLPQLLVLSLRRHRQQHGEGMGSHQRRQQAGRGRSCLLLCCPPPSWEREVNNRKHDHAGLARQIEYLWGVWCVLWVRRRAQVRRRVEEGGGNDDVMMRRWSSRILFTAMHQKVAPPCPRRTRERMQACASVRVPWLTLSVCVWWVWVVVVVVRNGGGGGGGGGGRWSLRLSGHTAATPPTPGLPRTRHNYPRTPRDLCVWW